MTAVILHKGSQGLNDISHKPRITFFLPGLAMGGAERHTLLLRAALRDRGYPTEVLVYGPRKSETLLNMDGVENAVFLDRRGMSDLVGWFRAYKALADQRADIIFGINQTPAIVAAALRLAGGTKAKVVCIFHTTLLRPNELRRLFIFRFAAKMFDAMVYVSRNQEKFWLGQGLKARRQLAITNGVDMNCFRPDPDAKTAARKAFGLAEADFVVGLVASFRPEKNHLQLVEVAAALRKEGIGLKVLFVGDGPTRPEIERRVQELGLGEHIVFGGERRDVAGVLAALDVGVLCSTAVETFSLAALELLAAGVPMIMSDIGGASEIIEDGVNGYLVRPGDMASLAEKLRLVAEKPRRDEMRRNARASVERYSLGRMLDAYEALVQDLTGVRA